VGLTAGNVAMLTTALHSYGAWYVQLVGFITMKSLFDPGQHRDFFSRLLAVA
jgi:hypothetical protein